MFPDQIQSYVVEESKTIVVRRLVDPQSFARWIYLDPWHSNGGVFKRVKAKVFFSFSLDGRGKLKVRNPTLKGVFIGFPIGLKELELDKGLGYLI